MLNPNIEIKKWFYTEISEATDLVVYDGFAPDGAGSEYIVLTGRTSSQEQEYEVEAYQPLLLDNQGNTEELDYYPTKEEAISKAPIQKWGATAQLIEY